ncbi:unnamed protein product [Didymodactylos carnosus]|uniref:BRCT domain-containing protein n=1 Tax=Didymodactylos carnosus TaxID=1234261 RepID=A0A813QVQ5_9BILA|nr:unnamed protein product [Didymodactylos carnosus]CAF0794675.1 unnamed protein product [Didymodactylos carnosus]CAF3554750.1 unnamed protein product [Didymodactylos carnosus]CAF3577553.1 unnamed protein product [Didymodactylos carnosus]
MTPNTLKLFSSVRYYVIGSIDSNIELLLKREGAIRSSYLTQSVTHVLCDDYESNRDECDSAKDIYCIPIIKSDWIINCSKYNSFLPVEPYYADGKLLFEHFTFANANLSPTDNYKLWALVTYYGGKWSSDIEQLKCTHILCSSKLSNDDNNNNTNKRLYDAYQIDVSSVFLITPDWVMDCLKTNERLDERKYHPDLLLDLAKEETSEAPLKTDVIPTENNSLGDTSSVVKAAPHHKTHLSTKNFFNQMEVNEDGDNNSLDDTPEDDHIEEEQEFDGEVEVSKPLRTKMTIPQQHGLKKTSSIDPAKFIIPTELEQKTFCPTIIEMPKPPPKTLSELKYFTQTKHEQIPSTQCLLGCILFIYEKEYIPTVSTNDLLSWSQTICNNGGIITDDENNVNLTHFVCAYRTSELFRVIYGRGNVRMVTAHWLNDVLQRKKLFVPNLAIHFPAPFDMSDVNQLPLAKYLITLSGFEGIERARLRFLIRSLGGKYTGFLGKWHSHLICKEEKNGDKYDKALEWSISIVNGIWLSELYLGNTCALKTPIDERYTRLIKGIDHFSFDSIYVRDLLTAWLKPLQVTDHMLNIAIKKHNEKQEPDPSTIPSLPIAEDNTNGDMESASKKIRRTYNEPCIPQDKTTSAITTLTDVSVMLSGFNKQSLARYEEIIKNLGGQISLLPHCTTHLVMKKCLRTEKLYECLNYVTYILNTNWLDKCDREKHFVTPSDDDYLLYNDYKPNTILRLSTEKRLSRNNKLLFSGYTFFLTPSVQPSISILKSIIYSTGANIIREFPSLRQLITRDPKTHIPSVILISCDEDKILLKELKNGLTINTYRIDFILESIIRQEVLINDEQYILRL